MFPFNCAKHNITRRKPNITAQQYNLPQGKYTCSHQNKKTSDGCLFVLVGTIGLEPMTLCL